ncbi:hypothetical protein K1T71_004205 [Dendrolimus kikuchii]|uniref:Uncharacterized protein n=1 Tax=Dendrolimus kikuchii TaxID=765133 RepID=A0ACC1DAI0_9NEOP|nr:hypothetical protein K1T71_004205 [Dendrolimus kikuchii]
MNHFSCFDKTWTILGHLIYTGVNNCLAKYIGSIDFNQNVNLIIIPITRAQSFVISWVIVCAIIESPTRGFTIPRTANNITEEADLTGEESSVLTVRHESKRLNDIHNYDNSKSESKEKITFENKQNSQEISTDRLVSKISEFSAGTISTLEDFNRKFIHSKDKENFSFNQYRKAPEEFQLTTEFTTSIDDDSYETTPIFLSETIHFQEDNSKLPNNDEVTKTTDGSLTSSKFVPSNNVSNSTKIHTTTSAYDISNLKTYTLANDLTAITLSIDELYSLKDLASSITEIVPSETATTDSSKVTNTYFNSRTSPIISIQRPDLKTASTKNKNTKDETINYSYSTPTISSKLGLKTIEDGISNVVTTDASTNAVTTEALWKKYTTLERKRITTNINTATESEPSNKAENSQTTISFDRTLNPNPTTPFHKFTDDINNINNKLLTTTIDYSSVTEQDYTPYELTTPKSSSKPSKIGVVSSKMAGFLDFSKISSRNLPTVQKYEVDTIKNESELSIVSENTTMDTTTSENKSTKVTETQSQLADDAINEELLKEESLNDNEDAKRYREGRPDILHDLKEVKPLAAEVVNINNLAYNQTEDTLIVQPINHDKLKNTILYAVSSKYKPMKKIDIQPPKQFVRNPDDNSWRNESINSLGIVYKPKNSSKSFIQVLKNKTEIELNNLANRDNKGGVLDLRQRLEKIAEVRKSKKKKTNKYGDTVYVDYEEGNASAEVAGLQKENTTAKISFMDAIFTTTPVTTDVSSQTEKNIQLSKGTNASTDEIDDFFKRFELDALTTDKPKKYANVGEYYDTTDEYDVDYLNMSNIDIKKHTWPLTKVTTMPTTPQTPASVYAADRQPTIQYFPPTTKKVKVNVNDYDDGFKKKVNLYTVEALPKDLRKALSPAPFVTMVTVPPPKEIIEEIRSTLSGFQPSNFNKNLYFTDNARVTEPNNAFVNEPAFNRGSYVIKHYKDFLNVAAKDDDYRNEYMTFTDSPVKGITINEFLKENGAKAAQDDYDYEQQFRKDLLNRFVANFNKNNERFKVDFPILFNNSVVHKKVDENGRVLAESTAFMKRLYDTATTKPNPYVLSKPCDPNCDKITVELSPAYELHYYVPEQEEKEEAEQPPVTMGYRQYRSKLD